MFSNSEVAAITDAIASDFGGKTGETSDAISVEITRGSKKVCIEWPKHDLAEIYMTFYEGNMDTGIYQDWFECMEQEDKAEFVEYTRTVAERFFANSARVKKRGIIIRRAILEIQMDGGWRDIFDPGLDR